MSSPGTHLAWYFPAGDPKGIPSKGDPESKGIALGLYFPRSDQGTLLLLGCPRIFRRAPGATRPFSVGRSPHPARAWPTENPNFNLLCLERDPENLLHAGGRDWWRGTLRHPFPIGMAPTPAPPPPHPANATRAGPFDLVPPSEASQVAFLPPETA